MKHDKLSNNQHSSVSQTFYHGIIPPPDMMQKYQEIDTTLPNRIMKLAEEEGIHRRIMEKKILNLAKVRELVGVISGIISVLVVGILSYLYLLKSAPREGAAIAIAVTIGLASVFVLRKVKQSRRKQ